MQGSPFTIRLEAVALPCPADGVQFLLPEFYIVPFYFFLFPWQSLSGIIPTSVLAFPHKPHNVTFKLLNYANSSVMVHWFLEVPSEIRSQPLKGSFHVHIPLFNQYKIF